MINNFIDFFINGGGITILQIVLMVPIIIIILLYYLLFNCYFTIGIKIPCQKTAIPMASDPATFYCQAILKSS